jgi:periplasmic protein TonB
MSAIAYQDLFSRVSQRGGVWLVIAAAHVAVVSAFASWSPVRLNIDHTPIEASIVDLPAPETAAPPPPPPQLLQATTPVIEPPVITLNEAPPPPNAITVAVAETPPAPAPVAPRVVSDVAYVEPPQPRYPPESKRSGEEGIVVLRVLINELGRAAQVDIERSSGHARLDNAARLAVQRALFRPYVENGVARAALAVIPIEFITKSRRAEKTASRG